MKERERNDERRLVPLPLDLSCMFERSKYAYLESTESLK